MVNWKAATALGVVLVALAVYALQTRGGPPPAASPGLVPCPAARAVELRIAGSDGKLTDAVRSSPGDPWRLDRPAPGPADGAAVDDLLAALAGLQPLDTLASPPAASSLGLDPASTAVTCASAGGGSYTLSIGSQNFDGSGSYARVGASAKVYVIPAAAATRFRDALDRPPLPPSPSPSGSPSPSPST